MTPRETRVVSSTTSAYSSSRIDRPPSTGACRSSSLSLIEELPDKAAGARCCSSLSPMPNGSSGKRAAEVPSSSSLTVNTKTVISSKKRRRIGVVCRTHSPVASPHNSPKTFKAVKRIPPTLPGVQMAAQVLKDNGVVVFPTERTYEACVRWSRERWESHDSSFFALAFCPIAPPSSSTSQASSLYHLYIPKHDLTQLDTLVGFPKKAFALKPPLLTSPTSSQSAATVTTTTASTTAATTTTTCKIYYFSETRWILHRLAQRYWPGPVKIYVPVRSPTSPTAAVTTTTTLARLPCELLQPLPCHTNQLAQGIISHKLTTTTAATPDTATTTTEELDCGKSSVGDETSSVSSSIAANSTTSNNAKECTLYLGLRCPSHPLTARILQEASASPDRTSSLWLGLPVQGSEESSYMTTAQDVAQQVTLRSAKLSGSSSPNSNSSTPAAGVTVHVVNGEDKRELFTVPTCQHSASISLWIDNTTRTIHVLGKDSSLLPFSVQQLERLLQEDADDQDSFEWLPQPRAGSMDSSQCPIRQVKSPGGDSKNSEMNGRHRVIRAVLRKWKVVHHDHVDSNNHSHHQE